MSQQEAQGNTPAPASEAASPSSQLDELLGVKGEPDSSKGGENAEEHAKGEGTPQEQNEQGKQEGDTQWEERYKNLQSQFTKLSQEVAGLTKGGQEQPKEQEQKAPLINYEPRKGEPPKTFGSNTTNALQSEVDVRLRSFAEELNKTMQPALESLQREIAELKGSNMRIEGQNVAAEVAQEFPELRDDKSFRDEVGRVMEESLANLGIKTVENRAQFQSILKLAASSVRAERSYKEGVESGQSRATGAALYARGTQGGSGGRAAGEGSVSDAIRQSVIDAAKGKKRPF